VQFGPDGGSLGVLPKENEHLEEPSVIEPGLLDAERCGTFHVDLDPM
jgi:hypothetical protein